MKNIYLIGQKELTIEDLEWILSNNIKVELAPEAKERIQKCRDYLDSKIEKEQSQKLMHCHWDIVGYR